MCRHVGHPIWKKMKDLSELRDELWNRLYKAGTESYSTDEEPSCVVHAMAQMFDKQSKFYEPAISQDHGRAMFYDVVGGSIVTTSNSSYAYINLLIHHPQVSATDQSTKIIKSLAIILF